MVWMERYKTSVAKKVLKLLNRVDDDLVEKLEKRLDKIKERGFDLGERTTDKLKALSALVKDEYSVGYATVYGELKSELADFSVYEADFMARLVESSLAGTIKLDLIRPSATVLKSIATSRPFQGALLRDWFSSLQRDTRQRIDRAVRIGMVEGETTKQIVQRIKGTRARKYKDGLLEISRRHANSITRTAVQHVSDRASQETWLANEDVIDGVMWVSTLDGRTSAICRQRDREIYEVGKAPAVPAHFNCRSRTLPYIEGISDEGFRASEFGSVPRKQNYETWLRKQSPEVQNEILGKAKGKLFRDGGLKLDRFQDDLGRAYTLEELRDRDNDVFEDVFGAGAAKSAKQRRIEEAEFKDYLGNRYTVLRDRAKQALKQRGVKHNLTEAEYTAVYAYTDADVYYKRLNDALRSGDAQAMARVSPMANVLDNAFEKLPKYKGSALFRSTDIPSDVFEKMLESKKFSDQAFMSTSTIDLVNVFNGDVRFYIPQSSSGRNISQFSALPDEKEILFPRAVKFDIMDVEFKENGITEVILNEQND